MGYETTPGLLQCPTYFPIDLVLYSALSSRHICNPSTYAKSCVSLSPPFHHRHLVFRCQRFKGISIPWVVYLAVTRILESKSRQRKTQYVPLSLQTPEHIPPYTRDSAIVYQTWWKRAWCMGQTLAWVAVYQGEGHKHTNARTWEWEPMTGTWSFTKPTLEL